MIFFTLKYLWQLLQQNLTPTVQLHQFQNSSLNLSFLFVWPSGKKLTRETGYNTLNTE